MALVAAAWLLALAPRPALADEESFTARATAGPVLTAFHPLAPFARIEAGYFVADRSWSEDGGSLVATAMAGFDIWWREDVARGWSVPLTVQAGYRHGYLIALGGGGVDLLLHDARPEHDGWGVLAPFAAGSAGLGLEDVRVLADVRIGWRWQWGATDLVQARLGLAVEVPLGAVLRPRRKRRR